MIYKYFVRPVLFKFDPENVHDRMISLGKLLGRITAARKILSLIFCFKDERLTQNVLGINFKNPVGLSAGFDKNSELIRILPSVGFGFAEVGSVTGNPCEGNKKPRLWRHPDILSIRVAYGLKNDGCEAIKERILKTKLSAESGRGLVLGVNVAMTNCKENIEIESAINDYAKAFLAMKDAADYLTVNISCPNAIGGQPFVEPSNLDRLLQRLDSIKVEKPVFVKLSPDMEESEIDSIIEVILRHRVNGVICSNLTKKGSERGGLSGKPVKEMSDKMISYIYRKAGRQLVIIGVGGIFSAEDAYRKIRLGATLVELITGMIYEGPSLIGKINKDLVSFLERDGFKNISEAIGADHRV
jgi:dihydroorotate dehydrogenase